MTMSELDKIMAVKEKSQAIGEFLDWLFEKGLHLARYLTEEEYESEDNREDEPWMEGETFKRHIIKKGELIPVHDDIEKLLADFFEINLSKVEDERRELLAQLGEGPK
jgi:hypothetical protein